MYDIGLTAKSSENPLTYVVYHKQGCIILVYGRGKSLSLSFQDSSDPTGIRNPFNKMHNSVDKSNKRFVEYK